VRIRFTVTTMQVNQPSYPVGAPPAYLFTLTTPGRQDKVVRSATLYLDFGPDSKPVFSLGDPVDIEIPGIPV
jgi:hypothetical protein